MSGGIVSCAEARRQPLGGVDARLDARSLSGAIEAAHGEGIGRLAAGAEILDRQQTQAAAHALIGDGVVAVLAIHRVGRCTLATCLADMQQG